MSEKTNGADESTLADPASDEPIGEVTRVSDFLPPPSELVPRVDEYVDRQELTDST